MIRTIISCFFVGLFILPAPGFEGDLPEIESFNAGEGKAIEIHENVLPVLEAAEELIIDGEEEATLEEIMTVAEAEEIALEEAKSSILSDPPMAFYALEQLRAYAVDNIGRSESEENEEYARLLKETGLKGSR